MKMCSVACRDRRFASLPSHHSKLGGLAYGVSPDGGSWATSFPMWSDPVLWSRDVGRHLGDPVDQVSVEHLLSVDRIRSPEIEHGLPCVGSHLARSLEGHQHR